MKTFFRNLIPVLLVLAVMAALAHPVYAASEPPPPGGDTGVNKPPHATPSGAEKPRPPDTTPDKVTQAVTAVYQADAVLKDSHGNPLPLASKLANDVIVLAVQAQGCPSGISPTWMGGTGVGCATLQTGANPINSAIADSHVLANWTVYVGFGDYPDAVTVNKAIGVVGEDMDTTRLDNPVTLTAGNVTLYNFTIGNVVQANGLTGAVRLGSLRIFSGGATGVSITNHSGTVELTGVFSDGNAAGATIQTLTTSGNVVITDSTFLSSTSGAGLSINAKNPVRIENVVARDNKTDGLTLQSFGSSLTIKNSIFSQNSNGTVGDGIGYGISMPGSSKVGGKVTLLNVMAGSNEEGGANFKILGDFLADNTWFGFNPNGAGLELDTSGNVSFTRSWAGQNGGYGAKITALAVSGVTLTDDTFDHNADTGIMVGTGGPITFNGVVSVLNQGDGADVNNTKASAPKPITVTNSVFDDNQQFGLTVNSHGAITLNHVFGERNQNGEGAALDNCQSKSAPCLANAAVNVLSTAGYNSFSQNQGYGLAISSAGAVVINTVHANNDAKSGIDVRNAFGLGNVTVTDADLGQNGGNGLSITTRGVVTISGLGSFQNDIGVLVDNSTATSAKTVTVSASQASGNNQGFDIKASGAITFNGVMANGNLNNFGAQLVSNGAVSLLSTQGSNDFSNDHSAGLVITAKGAVVLNDVSASGSVTSGGVVIDNSGGAGGVTISRGQFNGNNNLGLYVVSKGAITLNLVAADGSNTNRGVYLANNVSTAPQPVTVTNSEFNANYKYGLQVYSKGNLTLNHITSEGNGTGVSLDNCNYVGSACTGNGSVTVTNTLGPNYFDGNTSAGLAIMSKGAVTLKGMYARDNGYGIAVDNSYGTAPVSLTAIQMFSNTDYGLQITSHGAITLNTVIANGSSGGEGATIVNKGAVTAQKVDVVNSQFENNHGQGLSVTSKGAITLDKVEANSNGSIAKDYGVYLDNCLATTPGICLNSNSVTVKNTLGSNSFTYNYDTNLYIASKGAVSLTGVNSQGSQIGNGVVIIGLYGTSSTSLNSVTINGNNQMGLEIGTSGSISLNKVIASGNGNFGVVLKNDFPGVTAAPITITSSTMDNNQYGLGINSLSNITFNNVSASYNMDFGAVIDNCGSIPPGGGCPGVGNITILSTLGPNRFDANGWYGLDAISGGTISLNYTTANNNGMDTSSNAEGFSGMFLKTYDNKNITATCATAANNGKNGIEALLDTGKLSLKGVTLSGNNKVTPFPADSDPNLYVGGGSGTTIVNVMCSN